ncbi:MAG: heme exporter protein CcmB [Bacteroidetes bacterium]|jgi:heme exporter protein B|nr:heme exporter protein CcmB [Bacteroidota bacterium]
MEFSFKQFIRLIQHEFNLELKNKQAITSLLVYSLASIYISYLSYRQQLDPVSWNALFWIIMLFAATNAIARSFLQESRGIQLFHYLLLSPANVILAKTCYNILLLSALGIVNLLAFSLFFDLPIQDKLQFVGGLLLGSFGLSSILTLVSGIVSRAQSNAALVAILGFPLLFPLIITIIRFTQNAIEGQDWSINQPYFLLLISLNVMIVALSYLLFPYLWRE